MQENYFRFAKRFNEYSAPGMAIFATKYSTETMGALVHWVLSLRMKKQGYNSRLYLDSHGYDYALYTKRFLGFRMVNFSFYNLETKSCTLGVRNEHQM